MISSISNYKDEQWQFFLYLLNYRTIFNFDARLCRLLAMRKCMYVSQFIAVIFIWACSSVNWQLLSPFIHHYQKYRKLPGGDLQKD